MPQSGSSISLETRAPGSRTANSRKTPTGHRLISLSPRGLSERGEEGLQVLRNHVVEYRIAGITRCIGGNRWRHNSPHGQQGMDRRTRSCPSIYCSNVQYTRKKLTRECGGNMRDASPCRAAAVTKRAFGIPIHLQWAGAVAWLPAPYVGLRAPLNRSI